MGGSLFLLAGLYSLPLWIDSIWSEWGQPVLAGRRLAAAPGSFGLFVGRAALAGIAVAIMLVFRSRQSLDFIYFQF
jgi:hypothetical protein